MANYPILYSFVSLLFTYFLLLDKLSWPVIRLRLRERFGANKQVTSEIKVSLLYLLPLRLVSRLWGYLNKIPLPVPLRRPLIQWYATTFGCNLDEIEQQDLSQYENLGQFFRRSLKANVRPVARGDCLVSPADGRIVQLEQMDDSTGFVGSVKGIFYSVDNFLGPCTYGNLRSNVVDLDNGRWLKRSSDSEYGLYSTVIYLAPGDYHRFHSPADWVVKHRRHFSGRLFSVRPSFVKSFPDLFSVNERVAYYGEWKHGFFSMTAVGATNVGCVNVHFDQVSFD